MGVRVDWLQHDRPSERLVVTVFSADQEPITEAGFAPRDALFRAEVSAPVAYPAQVSFDGLTPGSYEVYGYVTVGDLTALGTRYPTVTSAGRLTNEVGEPMEVVDVFIATEVVLLDGN